MDEDELLEYAIQISIQESCQKEYQSTSEKYDNILNFIFQEFPIIPPPPCDLKCISICLHVQERTSEAYEGH